MKLSEAAEIMLQPNKFITRLAWIEEYSDLDYYESYVVPGGDIHYIHHNISPIYSSGFSGDAGNNFTKAVQNVIVPAERNEENRKATDWVELSQKDLDDWRAMIIAKHYEK